MKTTINYSGRMLCALLLCAGLVITGCYDDSAIQEQLGSVNEQLKDYELRLEELERLTARQNTNIESLQTIVTALQDKDYVTNVAPITEGREIIGYTIIFSKSGAVTIYNGKDGYVPVMGVKQDESDGQWYWTVDGEWLLDPNGDLVRASAIDGEDGEPGTPGQPGVTPTLKIVDGYWCVSYDGGQTWERYAPATGEKGEQGDSMFQEVTYDTNNVYITLADGSQLTVPRSKKYSGENMIGPATIVLEKVTATTATFTGTIDVSGSMLPFTQVAVYYSDEETFNIHNAYCEHTTVFNENGNFTLTLDVLVGGVKYSYCVVVDVKSERYYGDVEEFSTDEVYYEILTDKQDISSFGAEINAVIKGVSEEDMSDLSFALSWSRDPDDLDEYYGGFGHVIVNQLSTGNIATFNITGLELGTKYYYRLFFRYLYYGLWVKSDILEFTTLKHPYEQSYDLDVASATDLSSSGSANCYIISESGLYKFKPVKGNSNEPVGDVASASILWETFGTDTSPELLDLISGLCYKDGYITFQTADTFKEGNAVIAAKDASGAILWSWHIWLTDQPRGQEYYNAGTMMDRNLGATSATPGDVGALGLLYQWGRKDPFLGSSSISSATVAKSTVTWPSAVSSDPSNGTIAYATAHPTTFITYNVGNYDWYYTGSSSTDNTRWTASDKPKSIYDPCPSGWRVPDGGDNGVWSKALGSSSSFTNWSLYSSSNTGMNFSGEFGSASTIWYPVSRYRDYCDGSLYNVGGLGYYWSASPFNYCAYSLYFNYNGGVLPSSNSGRAFGYSVRCLQE